MLSHYVGKGWTVEIVTFTLSMHGSYHELAWWPALDRFGLCRLKATDSEFMTELIMNCQTEHDELFNGLH